MGGRGLEKVIFFFYKKSKFYFLCGERGVVGLAVEGD